MDLTLVWIAAIFLPAGLTKGVIGLGLPTIGMGLLALLMSPVEAAAVLALPSLVTNVWQTLAGARLVAIFRRLWPMMLGVCVGTWAGAGLMTGLSAHYATIALGAALMLYAAAGLAALRFTVRANLEPVLSPIVGAITPVIVPTLLALGVSLLGMWLGQVVRDRLGPTTFRRCFFAGLMMLGVYLVVRGIKIDFHIMQRGVGTGDWRVFEMSATP